MFSAASALAQDGLGGVTMRVLDDISDIDAVVLELEVEPAAGRPPTADAEGARQPGAAGVDREADVAPTADRDRNDEAESDGETPREAEPGAPAPGVR